MQDTDHENPCAAYNNQVEELKNTVRNLETNLNEANRADKQLIFNLNTEKIKYEGLNSKLEDALQENRLLLDILQQKAGEQDSSRTSSQSDLSSCSTMSIVHLQYKYEELLASHNGLLKLLEMKSGEIKKVNEENEKLKTEIDQIKSSLHTNLAKIEKLREKFTRMKGRKNEKIAKLKSQKNTLELVHNQLIDVLHNQCMERDHFLSNELRNCSESEKGLLLQEVRKNNMLVYENFQYNQQIEYLRSIVNLENSKCHEKNNKNPPY